MASYKEMSSVGREKELERLNHEYNELKSRGLKLDMSRGKPSPEQLTLSHPLLASLKDDYTDSSGVDCRNYGEPFGILEMRALFAELLGVAVDKIVVGGNSSLNMMFDAITRAYIFGYPDSAEPWIKLDKVKFLCPSPGYDRHFAITQKFGAEMITIPMLETGPDMDIVEKLVASDPAIKGMWCVPIFSNPDGIVYSADTVHRIASMKTAAPDFTVYWDNAYCVHTLYNEEIVIPEILSECEKAGNPNRIMEFASTSKISFSGAGVSCVAANGEMLAALKSVMSVQTIGHDKLNQLRHVRFFGNAAGVREQMSKQAEIIRPKFETVLEILDKELEGLDIAWWRKPRGGYFISLFQMVGSAKRTWELCKEAGVVMTGAGATYPYGKDPDDSNIRIAPTYPPIEELRSAAQLLCLCLKISALEAMR